MLTFAHLPPSTETPYATVTLDWYPEGGKRTSPVEAWNEIKEEVWGFHFRSEEGISAENDRLRVGEYIADELDKTARGAMIVSNSGEGTFEAASFGLSIPTTTNLGPIPYLKEFTRLVEDNPTYAILVLDQASAELSIVSADVHDRFALGEPATSIRDTSPRAGSTRAGTRTAPTSASTPSSKPSLRKYRRSSSRPASAAW